MDLDFSEEQQLLRETVRRVCAEHAPLEVVRRMEDDPTGYPAGFWKQLAETGITGVLIPEEHGGSGLGMLDAAIVYEELGRALSPSPHFASAVLGAGALLAAGSPTQQREWLRHIASGEAILTPAWLEPDGGFGARGVQLEGRADGDGFVLSGVKRHVPFASAANRLLVLARTGAVDGAVDLFLVDPQAAGVTFTQQKSLAADTQYEVRFDGVRVPASARVGAAGTGWATWDRVLHDGIVLLAALAMGGAERALEITVQYAKDRKQFDKPLGAFQAVSHYLADAATAIDGGKTLVYEAAWARDHGRSTARLAPMAKLFACQTWRDVTAMCQQVWGGVGFTIEYDIQLYFRRAKQLQISWWDTRHLEELVAADVLDGDAPFRSEL
ncbi:MAG TPA: acyl-CoA dehydrogenase family protein [Myxococcota bacterium]|nr:acyl-CoA dehydrogenase family protein [Myxococcota bacterium]